jgi:transketolase
VRKKLNWNYKPFQIPHKILNEWRRIGNKGQQFENQWSKVYIKRKKDIDKILKNNFSRILKTEKLKSLKELKSLASRKSSELTLNALTEKDNLLIGGSADLAGSNNTKTKYHKIIKTKDFKGNYIHYGVREHAMSGIMNGLALHSYLIPYGGTFLIFSDYCKPSIRLSALMEKRVIYVMTHDSIGLGEDGPTHQPIEQLSGLRSIPNLNIFRPADRMETIECWEHALKDLKTPSILSLTRQNLDPVRKKYSNNNKSSYGAYEVFRTGKKINLTILASGSEVNLAIETSHKLAKDKIYCKVISMPCMDLFDQQSEAYRKKILEETKFKISIEAASTDCWKKYIGKNGITFGINTFGKSAPFKDIYKHFGLTANNIAKQSKKLIRN